MRNLILTFLLSLISISMYSQNQDTWIAFWNKDSTLVGFKDKNGIVKIQPRFQSYMSANKFDDLIAVTEEINEKWKRYYLTKSGRIVGNDSLHIFDNGFDCESEGFIRFHDSKTDKVGMFNRNGDIVVPAAYNELARVRNGMIIALKGAEKKYWGEHYSWKGGRLLLIDTNNHILVDSFEYKSNLNFFSVRISPLPDKDTVRQSFKAVNGLFYSFVDFEKEFRAWLQSSLLNNFTQSRLLACSYNKITYWKEPGGWTSEIKKSFIDRNFELIRSKLLALNATGCDFSIFDEGLNSYIYESDEYKDFFNNCREPKDWIYPVQDVVISYKDKKDLVQDHFEFLRTEKGYRLISVTIRKGQLK